MSIIQVNALQVPELLNDTFDAGLVPMLSSSPGIGKSSLNYQVAELRNLLVIDLRLSQMDPTELNGFPWPNPKTLRGEYMPMNVFPLVGDELPDKYDAEGNVIGKYDGWLIFLDELPHAALMTQGAAFKLVLDRKVGNRDLHPAVHISAAGNSIQDKAGANRLTTAMQSRLIHLDLVSDLNAFTVHAANAGFDHRIASFVNFETTLLNNFDPSRSDKTFACERTWEFMSNFCKVWGDVIPSKKLPLMQGTVGPGAAREFYAFCQIHESLPTIASINANPETVNIQDHPGTKWAITGMVGNKMKKENADNLMKFICRLPVEFQIITMQIAIGKDPEIMEANGIKDWIHVNGEKLSRAA